MQSKLNRKLIDRCWQIQMPATAKSVLMAMVWDADADGGFTPDMATLMMRTCFEKSAVYQWVKWLEENGHIACFRTPGQRTRIVVNVGSIPANGNQKRAIALKVGETSAGFQRFWSAYPNTGRKVNLGKCREI